MEEKDNDITKLPATPPDDSQAAPAPEPQP